MFEIFSERPDWQLSYPLAETHLETDMSITVTDTASLRQDWGLSESLESVSLMLGQFCADMQI